MSNIKFFDYSSLYKEYLILQIIFNNRNVTQRQIAAKIGSPVSLVNRYIDKYEKDGLLKREKFSKKVVRYLITKTGDNKRKVLYLNYLKDSLIIYKHASSEISLFLQNISDNNIKKLLLYGAGDVAEIILQSLAREEKIEIEVIGIIDDDTSKQGSLISNIPIYSFEKIKSLKFNAILISSYSDQLNILKKLDEINFPKSKVILFFK